MFDNGMIWIIVIIVIIIAALMILMKNNGKSETKPSEPSSPSEGEITESGIVSTEQASESAEPFSETA